MTKIDFNLLNLLDNTAMCIKLFDSKGNLLFLNKYGRKEHFLADDADISKWNWKATIKKEYLDDVEKKILAIMSGSLVEKVEFEHTKEGSDHEWCAGALSSVKDEQGFVSGILFYSIDVTDKKKAEKVIKERMEELEKMNKLMVDREMKMIDLKNEIEELRNKSMNKE